MTAPSPAFDPEKVADSFIEMHGLNLMLAIAGNADSADLKEVIKLARGTLTTALRAAHSAGREAMREEAAKVAETYKRPIPPKPTIEELERILQQPDPPEIEITPDGEIRATGTHIGHDIAAAIRAISSREKE